MNCSASNEARNMKITPEWFSRSFRRIFDTLIDKLAQRQFNGSKVRPCSTRWSAAHCSREQRHLNYKLWRSSRNFQFSAVLSTSTKRATKVFQLIFPLIVQLHSLHPRSQKPHRHQSRPSLVMKPSRTMLHTFLSFHVCSVAETFALLPILKLLFFLLLVRNEMWGRSVMCFLRLLHHPSQ